jgi:hypothetical protein
MEDELKRTEEDEKKKKDDEKKKNEDKEKEKADKIAEQELMDAKFDGKASKSLELQLLSGKKNTHEYTHQLELLQSESDMRMNSRADAKI